MREYRGLRVDDIIKLIRKQPMFDDYIYKENGKFVVTQEWLCGNFAGRGFVADTIEEAVEKMIDYLYNHINHKSMVGDIVTKSGFPDLKKVKKYLELEASNEKQN